MRNTLGEFEHLTLLAILHLEDEAYGAAIIEALEGRSGREVSQAATYIALKRLEEKRFVQSRPGEATGPRAGRPRRYYEVTVAGLERLRQSRSALVGMWAGLEGVLDGTRTS